MAWQIGAALNGVIALSYFAIAWFILHGLRRTGQLGSNRLALATAAIFFTCAVHHGGHTVHVLAPVIGIDLREGLAMRRAFNWQMDIWDVVGAAVALFYVSLRRSYTRLLDRPEMFLDDLRSDYEQRLETERTALADAQAIARVGSCSWDARTQHADWSDEMFRIFGRHPELGPVSGAEFLAFVAPDDRGRVERDLRAAIAEGLVLEQSFEILADDGARRYVNLISQPLPSGDGSFVATVQDVTAARRAEDARSFAEARFRSAFDEAPIGMALVAPDGGFLRVNRGLCEMLGHREQDLLAMGMDTITHPDDHAKDDSAFEQLLSGARRSLTFEKRCLRADGETIVTRVSRSLVRDPRGRPLHFVSHIEDVTEGRRVRRALAAAEDRLRVTVEHAPIGVGLVDLRAGEGGRLVSVNAAFSELVGHIEDELLGTPLASVVHPEDADALLRDLHLLRTDETARVELEVRCLHGDGRIVWTLLTGAAVPAPGQPPRYAVLHALDIGERKRFEGQLQYLADHDTLTGLYNRRRFEEELSRALAHSERYRSSGAVMMIDLDGFKYVNDSMGHSFGDELVTRISGLIRSVVRETDVVARLGGDEFAVLLPEADEATGLLVAEKVLEIVGQKAIALSDHRHARVTASIGVTTFGSRAPTPSADELLVEADIAMYASKELGKNRATGYEHASDPRGEIITRVSMLDRLKSAIEDERFRLLAQPIKGICSEDTDRYELLLRIEGDDGELIPPAAFLYIAERFDLIGQIDRWVVGQAIDLLRLHRAAGHDIALSVNVSGRTFSDPALLEDLSALLRAAPEARGRLIVEVTETAAIVNVERARVVTRGLRELGCEMALDDFGAGFASFYYLKHLDFDYLKIDGEFVKSLAHNSTDRLVVQSVVAIAHGLGARTIAEFVTSEPTLEHLRELGVDYGQGFYLGRPQPLTEILPAFAVA